MKKEDIRFLCVDRTKSPSVGIPVYVKPNSLTKKGQPSEHKGGVIVEDLTFEDKDGSVYHYFKVKHKNGEIIWHQSDLVEIGGIEFPIDYSISNN